MCDVAWPGGGRGAGGLGARPGSFHFPPSYSPPSPSAAAAAAAASVSGVVSSRSQAVTSKGRGQSGFAWGGGGCWGGRYARRRRRGSGRGVSEGVGSTAALVCALEAGETAPS